MFLDDKVAEEPISSPTGHPGVSPIEFHFLIDCVLDQNGKHPKCRVKFVKSKQDEDLDGAEIQIDESDEKDLEDSTEEEKGEKPKKKSIKEKHKSKSHHKDEDEDDDIDDEDEDDEDDGDDGDDSPVLRCVAEAFDSCDEDDD